MDGIALASVISSAVVGVAAVVGSALGIRWAASLDRHNWLHQRKVEAYIEIVQAVEGQGEALGATARARALPEIIEEPPDAAGNGRDEARLSALERIYASVNLQQALSDWRYCMTQIAELLSYPDDSADDVVDTRTALFGDWTKNDQSGMVQDERRTRRAVIDVVAAELGQREHREAESRRRWGAKVLGAEQLKDAESAGFSRVGGPTLLDSKPKSVTWETGAHEATR